MAVNALRHMKRFNPDDFNPKRIDVIGAGATGSKIVMELAKVGLTNIHVWDFDKIESHNIPNQLFGNGDIGKLKVEALKQRVHADTGTEISIHCEKVDGSTTGLGEVVILAVDSMDTRKEIFQGAIKDQFHIGLMIEPRLGGADAYIRLSSINPTNPEETENWERNLYTTAEARASECGASMTLGWISSVAAGIVVDQLANWVRNQRGGSEYIAPELILSLDTYDMIDPVKLGKGQ